uniref:Core shell protein Gag P30 domain-containing protein n=1 Tax=Ficedula albicollis TaxID=59894 RepID=U3KIY8_FICAL
MESPRTPGVSRLSVALRPRTPSPGASREIQRTPLASRTRQGRKNQKEPQLIAPLREAVGPKGECLGCKKKGLCVGCAVKLDKKEEDTSLYVAGPSRAGPSALSLSEEELGGIKVPFSPSDLVIWKQSAGSYREDPERTAQVVKMVVKTQNPDWNDLQVLLDTLMDSTEKEMVLRAAKEKAREDIRTQRIMGLSVNEVVPQDDLGWDPNTGEGYRRLKQFQELVIEGVRSGMPKTLNWSKLYTVKQEKNESPSQHNSPSGRGYGTGRRGTLFATYEFEIRKERIRP